ncbi:zinc finger protein 346 isoform X3 [Melanotaenia boesemani]|uniref:zinc finger protein 346 isoform X3 n=1 Tax=Melanotaenia boesemani TaxID=1250792 RepID=UPI001C047F74|nr:zinc finger protein 346 isoform X3 [Melanotaenia boesemani]
MLRSPVCHQPTLISVHSTYISPFWKGIIKPGLDHHSPVVNKMIKEHGDLFSDSQCKVCSAVLISETQKLTHYQSKKHANKVRRYFSQQNEKEVTVKKLKSSETQDCNNGDTDRMKACNLCQMTFSSPVMAESHYQGKFHAKRLKMKTVESQPPEASQTAKPKEKPADVSSGVTAMDNNNNPDRFCSICKAPFNNPLMAQQHYVGKKHKKRMTKLKLMETYGPSTAPASTENGYPCTICNIELNSVEQYQSHISGARHKNQVKKSSQKIAENQQPEEQLQESNNQFVAEEYQYTAEDNQYTPDDDQYAPTDDQYGTGEEQYDANYQYAPENTEFSEQYQYT